MHLGEALMPREEAVKRAAQELRRVLDRSAPYYAKLPGMRPDPERPIEAAIRADDTWIYVPFARAEAGTDPLVVRVNGVTKVCVVDRSF
jgi:hypothetical protein